MHCEGQECRKESRLCRVDRLVLPTCYRLELHHIMPGVLNHGLAQRTSVLPVFRIGRKAKRVTMLVN